MRGTGWAQILALLLYTSGLSCLMHLIKLRAALLNYEDSVRRDWPSPPCLMAVQTSHCFGPQSWSTPDFSHQQILLDLTLKISPESVLPAMKVLSPPSRESSFVNWEAVIGHTSSKGRRYHCHWIVVFYLWAFVLSYSREGYWWQRYLWSQLSLLKCQSSPLLR